jgi:hypothetical protein
MVKFARSSGLAPLPISGTLWHFPAGVAYRRSTSTPAAVLAVIDRLKKEVSQEISD